MVIPKGFQQLASLGSATAVPIPSGLENFDLGVIIQAEVANVRWRADGTNPTAAVGNLLARNAVLVYRGPLDKLKFIEETTGAKLNVSYFGLNDLPEVTAGGGITAADLAPNPAQLDDSVFVLGPSTSNYVAAPGFYAHDGPTALADVDRLVAAWIFRDRTLAFTEVGHGKQGSPPFYIRALANTTAILVSALPCTVKAIDVTNAAATRRYVRFYDKSTIAGFTYPETANLKAVKDLPPTPFAANYKCSYKFPTGLVITITTTEDDTSAAPGAPTAGDVRVLLEVAS